MIDIKAMKSANIEDFQHEMIDDYAEAVSEFGRQDDEESFRRFCASWKHENNAGHITTPDYIY